MFMITDLIEPDVRKLILHNLTGNNSPEFHNGFLDSYLFKLSTVRKLIVNHLTGNNSPEFHNGLLDGYFFKLTLESYWLELCFCAVAFKTILTQ